MMIPLFKQTLPMGRRDSSPAFHGTVESLLLALGLWMKHPTVNRENAQHHLHLKLCNATFAVALGVPIAAQDFAACQILFLPPHHDKTRRGFPLSALPLYAFVYAR